MKTLKKSLSIFIAVIMVFSCLAVSVSAADEGISVFLRVEGINNCLFDSDVTVSEGATVYDVLMASGLDVKAEASSFGKYITAINGETQATFKGWDGWLYEVNQVEPIDSVDKYVVSEYDQVLFYYGDPYGVGMQRPEVDLSRLEGENKIGFTSLDTEYDESWNQVQVENRVMDYVLYFDGVKLVSDGEGFVTVPENLLTDGEHKIQIEKYAENGLPLVLRFSENTFVAIGNEEDDDDVVTDITFIGIIFGHIRDFFVKVIEFIRNILGI